jgi:transposase InsO family protein
MFSWIEGWYNPRRRDFADDDHSPAEYEKINQSALEIAA